MKLCLATAIFPPDIGGPATFIPRLAGALQEKGHQVSVVAVSERLSAGEFPFPVEIVPRELPRAARLIRATTALYRAGRDADLLFSNSLDLPAVIAAWLLQKPLALKIVGDVAWERSRLSGGTSDSIDDFQKKSYGLRIGLLKWFRSWVARRADIVVVPSAYLRKIVLGWGVPGSRIRIVYNAVEPEGASVRHENGEKRFKLVTVGRLVSWKGVAELIETVAELPERYELDVIGSGPEERRLKELVASKGIEGRVRLSGALARPDVAKALSAADLFVLNSTYEGHPHALLEAMAAGMPVVATSIGGNPEAVTHEKSGWLIPAGDGAALRAAIETLSKDARLRSRLAEEARRSVLSYTPSQAASKMIEVFEEASKGSVRVLYLYGGERAYDLEQYQAQAAPANPFWGLTHINGDGVIAETFLPETVPWWRGVVPLIRARMGVNLLHLPIVPRFGNFDIVFSTAGLDLPLIKKLLLRRRPRWVWMNFHLINMLTRNTGLKGRLIRWLIRSMEGVVCLTTYERDYFVGKFGMPADKVFFVPLGVDSDFLRPEKAKWPGEYVLAIGRDMSRDYKTFFEAMRGTGEAATVFCKPRNVEGLSAPPEVKVVHSAQGLPWGSFYFNSRFVVVPLRGRSYSGGSDCSGLTCILDSMAVGKAVIVSDVETVRDYVKDGVNGFLVRPEDPAALRVAIQKLAVDPDLARKMGEAGRRMVEERFTSAHFAENLSRIFKEVHRRA